MGDQPVAVIERIKATSDSLQGAGPNGRAPFLWDYPSFAWASMMR